MDGRILYNHDRYNICIHNHIETELHTIKTMIEEVIKFDESKRIKNGNGHKKVKTHLRETAIHSIMVIHYGEVLCHLLKT